MERKKQSGVFQLRRRRIAGSRLVEILNKYGLKATFNLCSAWLGNPEKRDETGKRITNGKVFPGEVRSLYAGHEVAGYTLTHPDLTQLPDETIAY